jgi:hypothetical protein
MAFYASARIQEGDHPLDVGTLDCPGFSIEARHRTVDSFAGGQLMCPLTHHALIHFANFRHVSVASDVGVNLAIIDPRLQ